MKVSHVYCDHCGKEIKDFDTDYFDADVSWANRNYISGDICSRCQEKLSELIRDFFIRKGAMDND